MARVLEISVQPAPLLCAYSLGSKHKSLILFPGFQQERWSEISLGTKSNAKQTDGSVDALPYI
jgi:hypothetical protein